MSIDLWIDKSARHAKVIVVRLLGGLDWWRYGVEALSALARERNIALAVLPGEDRDDPRLEAASTLPPPSLRHCSPISAKVGARICPLCYGDSPTMPGSPLDQPKPQALPRCAGYLPGQGAVSLDALAAALAPHHPVVPILFYRSALLAADTAPIDALCEALAARGLAPAPLVIPSLKDAEARDFVRGALRRLAPAVIVTTTAFAAGGEDEASALDGVDAPVLQVVIATTRRAAWQESPRGLGPADLAMHVVLPELDGRILAGAIAFKDGLPSDDALGFTAYASRPEPDRVTIVADRIAALARLRFKPRAERRIALLMPDYPGAAGRTAYAVGLDVPASIVALIADLAEAGYRVERRRKLRRRCSQRWKPAPPRASLSLQDYRRRLDELPADVADASMRLGARRKPMPMSATAPSASARRNSAICWWRCRPIADAHRIAAPPITTRRCRRAMRC